MNKETNEPLVNTSIQSLEKLYSGKVRDIYAVDDEHLLIIATDRISAFDVILPQGIAGKGKLLTQMAHFWFSQMSAVVPNHLTDLDLRDVLPDAAEYAQAVDRCMLVKRLKALPVEAVVRGYLIGSGWKDYQSTGQVCGIPLPKGLRLADKLPELIFTPATKAAAGDHDENIPFAAMSELVGNDLAEQIRSISTTIYRKAASHARARGIIIADTKFEFGLDTTGELVLMDEILTPDSSRFWPLETWQPGSNPESFDKQYIRVYLETLDWDKTAPGPKLPDEIIQGTLQRYRQALELLTGDTR